MDITAKIDDAGLRGAGGALETPLRRPPPDSRGGAAPNCLFLSAMAGDQAEAEIPLTGRAKAVYLLMTGNTFPRPAGWSTAASPPPTPTVPRRSFALRNPETWWPSSRTTCWTIPLHRRGPAPPRVDLRHRQKTAAPRRGRVSKAKGSQRAGRRPPPNPVLAARPRKDLALVEGTGRLYGRCRGVARRHPGAAGRAAPSSVVRHAE